MFKIVPFVQKHGKGIATSTAAATAVIAPVANAALDAAITGLFTDGAATAVLVVTAGTVAYGAWRGGLTALGVAKRMLSKAGL